MTPSSQMPKLLPAWRLWAPLLFQTLLIVSIPAQAVYTHLTGKTVTLQTEPVDPYDLFRGYSITVRYDISRPETLRGLPGWEGLVQQPAGGDLTSLAPGTTFYVVLEAPAASALPKSWQPIRVSRDRPLGLPNNQVALKGYATDGNLQYGLESYYIPEDQRNQINGDINQAQQAHQGQHQAQPILVEAKVDAQGHAVPVSFWVSIGKPPRQEIRQYRF